MANEGRGPPPSGADALPRYVVRRRPVITNADTSRAVRAISAPAPKARAAPCGGTLHLRRYLSLLTEGLRPAGQG